MLVAGLTMFYVPGLLKVLSVEILYDLVFFDHFPMFLRLDINCTERNFMLRNDIEQEFVNWKLFNNHAINSYQATVDSPIDGLEICDKVGCVTDYRPPIDAAYRKIVISLTLCCMIYFFRKFFEI